MSRNLALSITTCAEWCHILWTWRKLGRITISGYWGWFVVGTRIEGFQISGTKGDSGCPSSGAFPGWSIFGTKGGLREDLEWRKLLDGLDDVEVSKGVLSYLDMRHHPDEGQFLTITNACLSFACWNLRKESWKSRVGRRSFNALTSPWYLWVEEDLDHKCESSGCI